MLKVIESNREIKRAESAPMYVFRYEQLDAKDAPVKVLNGLFEGRSMERIVRSHWSAYPGLRDAVTRLLLILGHQWRKSESEPPLIVQAIESATEAAMHIVQVEGVSARHVVAAYLTTLTDVALEIADHSTIGIKGSTKLRWAAFHDNLPSWYEANQFDRIEVHKGGVTSALVKDGLRAMVVTSIATVEEAGMVLRQHY